MKLKQILEIQISKPVKYFTTDSFGNIIFKNGLNGFDVGGEYSFSEVLDGVWEEDVYEMEGMSFNEKMEYMFNNDPSDELINTLKQFKELLEFTSRFKIKRELYFNNDSSDVNLILYLKKESLKDYIK